MNKLKKFFVEKPEGNIWKRATFYLILLRYLGISTLIFILPLMAGLAAPGQNMDFHNASQNIAVAYENGMETLYEAGSNIAINNPIVSKVLLFLLGNIIWIFYAGMFMFIIDVVRYIISWIYGKFAKGRVGE